MGAARYRLAGAALLPLVIGVPVAMGLAATLLQAFGIMPGLSQGSASLDAWRQLLDAPGLWTSVGLTLRTGLLASLLAVLSALLIGLCGPSWAVRGAAPLLGMPHAALAVGLGFLIAPTGWLVRLAGLPPLGVVTVGDRFGGAVVLALWLKETPFLLASLWAASGQAEVARARIVASSLGYAGLRTVLLVVLPRLWPQWRLPVMAVIAFSLSVTDVPLLLGPQTPPTLAVRILKWSADPDLSRWGLAAAGAALLLGVVLASFATLRMSEVLLGAWGRWLAATGYRGSTSAAASASAIAAVLAALAVGALATLVLWAGAASWRFPAVWPAGWSGGLLAARLQGLWSAAATTLWLAAVSTAVALGLAVMALSARRSSRIVWLPLLLPQAGFLFGVQILLVWSRLDGSALALVWSHLLFVLPYVLLTLHGPWRALDARYMRAAAALGASPWRVLIRVTLPLLTRPIALAAAIGVSVSVALYLPTLFAGAGRVETLATTAVSLASGADRRLLAAAALAQAAIPAAAFLMAIRR